MPPLETSLSQVQNQATEALDEYLALSKVRVEDLAYSNLLSFCGLNYPKYEPAWFHRLIAAKLEALERGEITRLMISLPPRHGKSMTASEFFPAWYLGRNPTEEVIFITYNQQLASDVGQRVRALVEDPLYSQVFPGTNLSDDTASKHRFNILHAGMEVRRERPGSYLATGVDGTVTGKGAHLLIIDDPYKSRMDADSDATRKQVWSFYNSVAQTRLYPNAKIVMIMTRWREDDLFGQIKRDHAHEKWDELVLPAIDKFDNPLWPERYSLKWYKDKKLTLPAREWQSLYQGKPLKEGGNLFKKHHFKLLPHDMKFPDLEIVMQSLDGAYGSLESSSKTAETTWGICQIPTGDGFKRIVVLLDCWTSSVTFTKLRQIAADEYQNLYGPSEKNVDLLIVENKASGISLIQELQFTGLNVLKYNLPGGKRQADKESRAHTVSHLVELGYVYIPESKIHPGEPAEFALPFLEQVLGFPGGHENDDYVDTFTMVLRYISDRNILRAEQLVTHEVEPKIKPEARKPLVNPYAE